MPIKDVNQTWIPSLLGLSFSDCLPSRTPLMRQILMFPLFWSVSFGWQVHGIIRRSSSFNTSRIEHLYKDKVNHKGGGKLALYAYKCGVIKIEELPLSSLKHKPRVHRLTRRLNERSYPIKIIACKLYMPDLRPTSAKLLPNFANHSNMKQVRKEWLDYKEHRQHYK